MGTFIGFIGLDKDGRPLENAYGEVLVFESKEHLEDRSPQAVSVKRLHKAERRQGVRHLRPKN